MNHIDIKGTSSGWWDAHYYDTGLFDKIPEFDESNSVNILKGNRFFYKKCLYQLEDYDEITFLSAGDAVGRLIIPKNISINGKDYPVTKMGSYIRCQYDITYYHGDRRRKPTNESGELLVGAFWGTKITDCVIPPSIREIEEVIWANRANTLYATLPSEPKIKEIIFSEESPSQLRTIDNNVFYNCHFEMGTLKLPEGLRKIGSNSFCGNFTKVILPSTLEQIDESAFWKCSIKSMKLNDGLEYLGPNFVDLYHFTEKLEIPSSVINIPQLEWTFEERWEIAKKLPCIVIHNNKKDVEVDKITKKYCRLEYIDASEKKEIKSNWIRNAVYKAKKPTHHYTDSGREITAKEDFDGLVVSAIGIGGFFIFLIILFTVISVLVGVGVLE